MTSSGQKGSPWPLPKEPLKQKRKKTRRRGRSLFSFSRRLGCPRSKRGSPQPERDSRFYKRGCRRKPVCPQQADHCTSDRTCRTTPYWAPTRRGRKMPPLHGRCRREQTPKEILPGLNLQPCRGPIKRDKYSHPGHPRRGRVKMASGDTS